MTSLTISNTELDGVLLIECTRHGDARGAFSETWSQRDFAALGADHDWVQDNEAYSAAAGTVRGLHFQVPPHAQTKLVRVLRGRIADVAVDARRGSPAYGRHVCIELSADGRQLLVPRGFLHGYMTLEPDTTVFYKVDGFYSSQAEGAVAWSDPDLGVDWGRLADSAIVSDRDAAAPRFADFDSPFVYER